jgi:hypothetical protein
MIRRCNPFMTSAVVAGLVVGVSTAAFAQTTGSAMAPSGDTAGSTSGGMSPQNIPIAPGGVSGREIERLGPGVVLAPGDSRGALVSTPAEPASRGRGR